MQSLKEQETELGAEEDWCLEEDAAFTLQCGDSLSIAANHIGEDAFGARKRLLRGLRGLRRGRRSVEALVPLTRRRVACWGFSETPSVRASRRSALVLRLWFPLKTLH
jgi:hypothetical protein